MSDSTPKQRDNEDKFLKPALGQLQPYYADLFDFIMRGKRRGDGLMLSPEVEEDIEEELKEKKGMKDEIEREVAAEVTEERFGESVRYLHKSDRYESMDFDKAKEVRDEVKSRTNERFHERLTEDDMFMFEAFYLINTIKSDDRGSMNMKARFMTTTMKRPEMMERRSHELKAVAEVFEQYRSSTENPDVSADDDVLRFAGSLYGEKMANRMKEKKQEQQEFIEERVIS